MYACMHTMYARVFVFMYLYMYTCACMRVQWVKKLSRNTFIKKLRQTFALESIYRYILMTFSTKENMFCG